MKEEKPSRLEWQIWAENRDAHPSSGDRYIIRLTDFIPSVPVLVRSIDCVIESDMYGAKGASTMAKHSDWNAASASREHEPQTYQSEGVFQRVIRGPRPC